MELLSFGLYLFSLVFLLFPFLCSCLSCDSFCWLPFRLRFFLLFPFVFSYLVFPPAAFTFCQVSAFRLQVFFLSGGFVFPSGFAFWNEAKTKAKTKAKFTTSSLAWTCPGAGKPSSPSCYYCNHYHGPSCAFAAGICLTSTSKAPTAPASPRLLLLLMQLLLMLMLMLMLLCWCWCW